MPPPIKSSHQLRPHHLSSHQPSRTDENNRHSRSRLIPKIVKATATAALLTSAVQIGSQSRPAQPNFLHQSTHNLRDCDPDELRSRTNSGSRVHLDVWGKGGQPGHISAVSSSGHSIGHYPVAGIKAQAQVGTLQTVPAEQIPRSREGRADMRVTLPSVVDGQCFDKWAKKHANKPGVYHLLKNNCITVPGDVILKCLKCLPKDIQGNRVPQHMWTPKALLQLAKELSRIAEEPLQVQGRIPSVIEDPTRAMLYSGVGISSSRVTRS